LVTWLREIALQLQGIKIPIYAAGACYFIVLAIFPALLLVLSLLKYTRFTVENLMAVLDGVIPRAFLKNVEQILTGVYGNSSRMVVGLSAAVALWSAGRGVYGLMTGLNAIYRVREHRGFLLTRLICVGYTFGFILVLLLTLVLHVFGTKLVSWLPARDHWLVHLVLDVINLRFFFLLAVQTVLFTAIYMVFPDRRNGFWESLPGALLASIGWLVFSDGFSCYVEHFPGYANVYGSVYAVALGMLWLYFCISIVFYGGILNYWIGNQNQRKNVSKS
jgi:membrane protein